MKTPDNTEMPVPRHRLRYVILKFAVLGGGVLLALYLAGWL